MFICLGQVCAAVISVKVCGNFLVVSLFIYL